MDRSLINVSDGLCLPWISGDLNSKLLEKTPVSMIAKEPEDVRSGHITTVSRLEVDVCYKEALNLDSSRTATKSSRINPAL